MDIVRSKNDVSIRLPDQRWGHITEEHCEMAGRRIEVLEALANPEQILEGPKGELLAVKPVKEQKYVVVVYKELNPSDGFVITAFLTRRIRQLERRSRVWPR